MVHETDKIYGLNGANLAFIVDDSVYSWNGAHIGWWQDGHIRDRSGAVALFTVDAEYLGVARPARSARPAGIQPGALVIEDGKELFLLNQKLNALLRCVMLIELGISFEHLQQPLAYQANRWS